jgi:hypothetical protein
MAQVNIPSQKRIYSDNITKVVNANFTSFTQTVDTTPAPPIVDVPQFFSNYNNLFYSIPKTGTNSHETLIEKSSEYIGLNLQQLLLQLQELQIQNELLQKQINTFNNQ